jgi:hypothetical protein
MSSLSEIQEKISVPPKQVSKYASLTTRFRAAFQAIITSGMSIRGASKLYGMKRKHLVLRYEKFLKSGISVDKYIYSTKIARGRRFSLSPAGLSSLKIAAHSLDSIGRPISTSSLNLMIRSIAYKEGTKRVPCRATLQRWRKRLAIPKKSVRNGPGSRKKKSEAHYVQDFFNKLVALVREFNIKMEFMFVLFHLFLE